MRTTSTTAMPMAASTRRANRTRIFIAIRRCGIRTRICPTCITGTGMVAGAGVRGFAPGGKSLAKRFPNR
jgi:hypothetical protein